MLTLLALAAAVCFCGGCSFGTANGPRLSADSYAISQGTGTVTVMVQRPDSDGRPLQISYATMDAGAAAGTDYSATSGDLQWSASDTAARKITVAISNAKPFIGDRRLLLKLSPPPAQMLGTPSIATITIQGDGDKAARLIPLDAHVLVDQFGYRPGDPKVAVIRNPDVGYDSSRHFAPGSRYELRRATDGVVVFSGTPVAWNAGRIEASSGDNGWWFDFSSMRAPGTYFVYDVERGVRSAAFAIDDQVYRNVLKAAMRMYFYQRSGFAKRQPYAESCWVDDPAYVGPGQDTQARDIADPDNDALIRDVSGGWFDAGDTNRYVTFTMQPVHQLLTAYQENPAAFTDDFGIPESGNGIPDVIDEVKWETDWLKRMQYPDGSSALKVGETVWRPADPPSSDSARRFYVPACTSATIAVAGMFAHASWVYSRFPALATDAADLRRRAIAAWSNYQSHPVKQTDCDNGIVHAAKADLPADEQSALAVVAAIYLYAVTGTDSYDAYIKAHYQETRPYHDFGWSRYKPEQGEALLFYTTLPDADTVLRQAILDDKRKDVAAGNQVYGFVPEDDLYRDFLHAPQYHWGSNNPRAAYGNTNLDAIRYGATTGDISSYMTRALGVLHYLDGVNPFGKVYLTNMYEYGATNSVNELFHTWFWAGSRWDDARTSPCGPAPGYVAGGPVANAAAAGIPASISPPAGQPPQKSYRDWNGNSPQDSWIVNEGGIYYQSGYVKLLSAFAR